MTPHDIPPTRGTPEYAVEIRERTARIEAKLDFIRDNQHVAVEAKETATRAEAKADDAGRDITELKEDKRWTSRAILGLVFAAVLNLIINYIQGL